MSAKALVLILSLVGASHAALAQDSNTGRIHENFRSVRLARATEPGDTLDVGVAGLAAKAAFTPPQAPSQQELLDILLFLSLRNRQGHGT
jgi:hypothetical protein